ncbi:hypothetical protein OG21DRAFT_230066 [Imleria badia]|nr:hypothetical protein OG21DRAFT_230066 [Imleria badia]
MWCGYGSTLRLGIVFMVSFSFFGDLVYFKAVSFLQASVNQYRQCGTLSDGACCFDFFVSESYSGGCIVQSNYIVRVGSIDSKFSCHNLDGGGPDEYVIELELELFLSGDPARICGSLKCLPPGSESLAIMIA